MERKVKLGAALATAVAVAAATSAVALSDGGRSSQVLRFQSVLVEETPIDVGPAGPSQGDQLVQFHRLMKKGKQVGSDSAVCTLVRVTAAALTNQCRVVFRVPRGQITGQAMTRFTEDTEAIVGAITGGTGNYRRAHGTATIRLADGRVTLRILR